jgi:hypothetical protein
LICAGAFFVEIGQPEARFAVPHVTGVAEKLCGALEVLLGTPAAGIAVTEEKAARGVIPFAGPDVKADRHGITLGGAGTRGVKPAQPHATPHGRAVAGALKESHGPAIILRYPFPGGVKLPQLRAADRVALVAGSLKE